MTLPRKPPEYGEWLEELRGVVMNLILFISFYRLAWGNWEGYCYRGIEKNGSEFTHRYWWKIMYIQISIPEIIQYIVQVFTVLKSGRKI